MSHQARTIFLASITVGAIGTIVGIIVGLIVFFISISVFAEDAAAVKVDAFAAKKLVRTEARAHGSSCTRKLVHTEARAHGSLPA